MSPSSEIIANLPRQGSGSSMEEMLESLVDLFTMLSFMLIFAAFFFRMQAASNPHHVADAQIYASRAEGGRASVPSDLAVFVVFKEGSNTRVSFACGETQREEITVDNVRDLRPLHHLTNDLHMVARVWVIQHVRQSEPDPQLVLNVAAWLNAATGIRPALYIREQ